MSWSLLGSFCTSYSRRMLEQRFLKSSFSALRPFCTLCGEMNEISSSALCRAPYTPHNAGHLVWSVLLLVW
jgi:hypothetical protein